MGPDGNLWFTDGKTSSIWRINPTTYSLSQSGTATLADALNGITAGPDGNLRYGEQSHNFLVRDDRIGQINPATLGINEYPTPTTAAGLVTAPQLLANGDKGTFTVIASVAGLSAGGVFDLTIA